MLKSKSFIFEQIYVTSNVVVCLVEPESKKVASGTGALPGSDSSGAGATGGTSSSSAAAAAAAQAAAVAARVAAAAAAGIQGLGVPGLQIAGGPVTNEDIKVPDKMVGLSKYRSSLKLHKMIMRKYGFLK